MNSKPRRTLAAVFQRPPPSDIRWDDVESLFRALGAELTRGRGSRVRVGLDGIRAGFHEPHPRPHMDRAAVNDVREFLEQAGVRP